MSESSVNVTEGSGKRLHTYDRTISTILVQDQFTLPGEYPYASYTVTADGVSIATSLDHILEIMAGSSNYVRIRRIRVQQASSSTTAGVLTLDILRLTTAGTGGTSVTPAKLDLGDAAAGATAMFLPSSKGTESTRIARERMTLRSAYGTNAGMEDEINWLSLPNAKPLIIPAGTSNGICLRVASGQAGATVDINVDFVETAWLGA